MALREGTASKTNLADETQARIMVRRSFFFKFSKTLAASGTASYNICVALPHGTPQATPLITKFHLLHLLHLLQCRHRSSSALPGANYSIKVGKDDSPDRMPGLCLRGEACPTQGPTAPLPLVRGATRAGSPVAPAGVVIHCSCV